MIDFPSCLVLSGRAVFDNAESGLRAADLCVVGGKIVEVSDHLNFMREADARVGFGTDLLGPLQSERCTEWHLRSRVFSNFEMLVQATSANSEIVGMSGEIGVVAEGARADLLVVDGNPLNDITLLMGDGAHISAVITDGQVRAD